MHNPHWRVKWQYPGKPNHIGNDSRGEKGPEKAFSSSNTQNGTTCYCVFYIISIENCRLEPIYSPRRGNVIPVHHSAHTKTHTTMHPQAHNLETPINIYNGHFCGGWEESKHTEKTCVSTWGTQKLPSKFELELHCETEVLITAAVLKKSSTRLISTRFLSAKRANIIPKCKKCNKCSVAGWVKVNTHANSEILVMSSVY